MLRLQKSIAIVWLFTLFACAQKPILTSEADTATQTAVPTHYHGGTFIPITPQLSPQTGMSSPIPPLALTEPFISPDFSPILYAKKYDANTFFSLLGGVQGDEWLASDQAFARFAGAREYDVYSFGGGKALIHGHAPKFSMISQKYFIGTDVTHYENGMVGVAQGWQVIQRKTEELSSENEFYRQVVTDWLSQARIADPKIGTIQIFRTDLEGDGTDEIFINATRVQSQHTVQAAIIPLSSCAKSSAMRQLLFPSWQICILYSNNQLPSHAPIPLEILSI